MRVFVLGGTGSIGSPTARELVRRGHQVWALARSDLSATKLRGRGATPISGDIALREQWIPGLPRVDAVVHAACDFKTDMGAIAARLLDCRLLALAAQPTRLRFVYTGGRWLFGATGTGIATERTPFRPRPAFAWMVPHLQRILEGREVGGIVIHPARVYAVGGGVMRASLRLNTAALSGGEISRGKNPLLHCTAAGSTPLPLDHESFAVCGPFALVGNAFYPVLVHRPAASLHTSSPQSVAFMQLRFALLVMINSRWDFNP